MVPPRYPVPREPRGERVQELYSLATRLGWRMIWVVYARLWKHRESHPNLLGSGGGSSEGGILRLGFDGCTGVSEFSKRRSSFRERRQ